MNFLMTRVYFPSPYRGVWDGARVLGRTSLRATNLVWLLWAVWGGFFITKIILSNWLAITIKPVFDKPVDTAEVGRIEGGEWIKRFKYLGYLKFSWSISKQQVNKSQMF